MNWRGLSEYVVGHSNGEIHPVNGETVASDFGMEKWDWNLVSIALIRGY